MSDDATTTATTAPEYDPDPPALDPAGWRAEAEALGWEPAVVEAFAGGRIAGAVLRVDADALVMRSEQGSLLRVLRSDTSPDVLARANAAIGRLAPYVPPPRPDDLPSLPPRRPAERKKPEPAALATDEEDEAALARMRRAARRADQPTPGELLTEMSVVGRDWRPVLAPGPRA